MREIADKANPVTGADHLGTELGEPFMRDRAGLEVANVVGRIVYELNMADAALVRLLQSLEFHFQKVEPLYIGKDCRLARLVRSRKILGSKGAAQPVLCDHIVQPGI